jgi:hypothetical protein
MTMPWIIERDRNRYYEGNWPFDEADINQKINELEQFDNHFNRPQSICRSLRNVITTHRISKNVVFIFSKWCEWDYRESMNKAREISMLLFEGTICPRLYFKRQRKTEELANADELYDAWINTFVHPY